MAFDSGSLPQHDLLRGHISIRSKTKRRPEAPLLKLSTTPYELAFSTVTARRFCDQHEMSLHTATGRSLP
jgi:hypothetical protein